MRISVSVAFQSGIATLVVVVVVVIAAAAVVVIVVVGRAIAQAISRQLPTAAARVQNRVWSCGIL
jgi:uncharacterized membrane protein